MAKLKECNSKEKPPKLISVGDVVSKNMHDYWITSFNCRLLIISHCVAKLSFTPTSTLAKKRFM